MSDGWIVIPNWDKFQHYKDRSPVWIKLYTELAHDDDWLHLSYADRGLLVQIWIEYALSKRALSAAKVRSMVHRNSRDRALGALQKAGWIEVSASRPLAARYQDASPEKRRKEKEKGKPVDNSEKQKRKAKAWIDNVLPHLEGVDLAYTISDQFHIDDQDIVADLISYAQERMLGRTL